MTPRQEHHGIANRILLSLPETTLQRIQPALELRDAAKGHIVSHVDQPIEHMYFVNRGLISLVKTMRDGRTVEIGAVGIEGVTDAYSLLGINKAVLETIVQIPGTVFCIARETLRGLVAVDVALREIIENYARFSVGQIAQTAACNRLHSIEERCCRWLLVAHDSALSNTFPLTHEFLAMMLGVERAGVSIAASLLQKAGLINYKRGVVTITNRSGIEDAACECYGAMQAELRKLFPSQAR